MSNNSQYQSPFGFFFQEVIAHPQARHYIRMKNAIWLYLYLISFANPKNGKFTSQLSDIAANTGYSVETIQSWLGHLRKQHYVSMKKQGSQLIFKINQWRNLKNKAEEDIPLPIKQTSKRRKKSSQEKIVASKLPSASGQLAQYIATKLQASQSLPYFENLCNTYPREVVIQAFKEACRIPAGKIKKSRGALFVYLTKKYAQEK